MADIAEGLFIHGGQAGIHDRTLKRRDFLWKRRPHRYRNENRYGNVVHGCVCVYAARITVASSRFSLAAGAQITRWALLSAIITAYKM